MKKKILFIINPVSGIGEQKIIEKLVEENLDKQKFDHSFIYTNAPKHATELSKKASENSVDIVVAVGGDGTVNEVVGGLVKTTTAMAILPIGSGNGFARHLKIPMNLAGAINVINQSNTTTVDTGEINGMSFVNIAGVGFDAQIASEFAKFGKRGFASYIKVFLRECLTYKTAEYTILIDTQTLTKKALLMSFSNGSQYGNEAFIAPQADIKDGLIDVCILKKFPFYALPQLAYQLFNKTIHRSKYLETIRGKEITIKQSENIAHIDGEPVELGNDIKVKVNPLSLKVIIP